MLSNQISLLLSRTRCRRCRGLQEASAKGGRKGRSNMVDDVAVAVLWPACPKGRGRNGRSTIFTTESFSLMFWKMECGSKGEGKPRGWWLTYACPSKIPDKKVLRYQGLTSLVPQKLTLYSSPPPLSTSEELQPLFLSSRLLLRWYRDGFDDAKCIPLPPCRHQLLPASKAGVPS